MKFRVITIASILSILLYIDCNKRSGKDYYDIESLLFSQSKNKSLDFNKFPPRLVRAFLRYDNSNNKELEDLLLMTNLFIVVHVEKDNENATYKMLKDDVSYHLNKLKYEQIRELNLDNIYFKEFFFEKDSKNKELVLEINEPELYTVYCLKGDFSREEINRVSNNVSPVDFLRLNRKIHKKNNP